MIAQILKILLLKIQIKKLSGLAILRKMLNFISKSKTAKKGLKSSYIRKKNIIGTFKFQKISHYNCYNVVGSIITAIEMGISSEKIKKISQKLDQPSRRFEKIYNRKNITIIDDYAHHHNAIKEVRKFIKDDTETRTILVFQPHRFTRLKKHYKDFLNEISLWKEVIVSDIYSAFEKTKVHL